MSTPRWALGALPTPITEAALPGGERLLLKRDDLTGFGVAGNKVRALEHLMDQADHEGCTTVVGGGTPKSNFIAGLALAARVTRRSCEILLVTPHGGPESTTVALARAWGARVVPTEGPREQLDRLIADRASELTRTGQPALPVPRGGATPVGAMGFARAAEELSAQVGVDRLTVVVPVGSGASVAGLAAGAAMVGARWDIVGVSVSRSLEEMEPLVRDLGRGVAHLLGGPEPAPVELIDARQAAEAADAAAASLLRDASGILLDPVYGVRALPVAVERARGESTLLWLTGGMPSAIELALHRGTGGGPR